MQQRDIEGRWLFLKAHVKLCGNLQIGGDEYVLEECIILVGLHLHWQFPLITHILGPQLQVLYVFHVVTAVLHSHPGRGY